MPSHRPRALAARTVMLSCTLGAASACTDAPITAPSDSDPIAAAVVPGGPDVVAAVRGGAHFDLLDPPSFGGDFKWIYQFSIHAEMRAEGETSGSIQMVSRIPPGSNEDGVSLDWWFEMAVDCLEVDGNTAWMTGPIVRARTDSPFGPQVGPGPGLVMVQDNGPGNGDWINVGPASFYGAEDCHDKPPIQEAATQGNVTIFPRP